MKRLYFVLVFSILFGVPFGFAHAQQVPIATYEEAKVIQVLSSGQEAVGMAGASDNTQSLQAQILNTSDKGNTITVENDYPSQLIAGDTFYVTKQIDPQTGTATYSFKDPNRLPGLAWLVVGLLVLIFLIGGKQGIRGLASLVGSLLFIIYVLLPGVLHGYSPVLMSIGVASLIVILGSYITHGFSKTTTSAVIGMIITILFTGFLAYASITYIHLTGFSSDDAVFLSTSENLQLNFAGILLGGILIGILGILYDAAIGQAVSVEELTRIGPHLSQATIYRRALRIGREHIGALINTLAIAYVGASLPLLLLITSTPGTNFLLTINRDLFATEISRIIIGSIGLILTVPITTFISTLMLVKKSKGTKDEVAEEKSKIQSYVHTH